MTKLIVDVGSNWRKFSGLAKNFEIAKRQIEAAKEGGADYVKFQMYTDKELYGQEAPGVNEFALPREWVPKLKLYCDSVGIGFMCTGFSVEGYKYLNKYVDVHKVASAEATSIELVQTVQRFGKPWLISNGAQDPSTLADPNCIMLYCIGEYPTPTVKYINELKSYGLNIIGSHKVGISDHTPPHKTDMASIARLFDYGWVECHFDYNPELGDIQTPDAPVSRSLSQLKEYSEILKSDIKADKDDFLAKYGRVVKGRYRPLG